MKVTVRNGRVTLELDDHEAKLVGVSLESYANMLGGMAELGRIAGPSDPMFDHADSMDQNSEQARSLASLLASSLGLTEGSPN